MKISLFDFQKDSLHRLRAKLLASRQTASIDNPQAIAFSAPTGSGKTIVMTALFEALLVEPDDQLAWPDDWKPQSDAVILWVSDMPELNDQTRRKIESKTDRINWLEIVTIDSTFDARVLAPGNIYFVNTQKLGNDKLLSRVGDGRQYSIWTTFTNTAKEFPDRFYVVIDEAHRGMQGARKAEEGRTLMQRFLLGSPDIGLVKMPQVIGISATPQRFLDLLSTTETTVHKVQIPSEEVRLSGLLKDRVLIHHPESGVVAELTLLEEATRRWVSMTGEWKTYCEQEKTPVVRPILVVQVENGTTGQLTKTDLNAVVASIQKVLGRNLTRGEVVHAFHDESDINVGDLKIRKVEASRIEEESQIGVVLFKTSLSTGWDCPRAEVMMSFRRAEDHTFIAQLLGRMVRTPLARRVEREAALNDVHLFLPYFDVSSVKSVIEALKNTEDVPPSETGEAKELTILRRAQDCEALFEAISKTITYRVGTVRAQSDLRRYIALSRSLTLDGILTDAWDKAKAELVDQISAQISFLKADPGFEGAVEQLNQVGVGVVAVDQGTGAAERRRGYLVAATDEDIDRLFDDSGRRLSNGLHLEFVRHFASPDLLNVRELKIQTILLSRSHAALSALESFAADRFARLFDQTRKSIYQLPETRRVTYERLRLAANEPQSLDWRLPDSIDFRSIAAARVWDRHLYRASDGSFRCDLGTWETAVLQTELHKPEIKGWLRNLDRKPWSLEIPYETGGVRKPMFPDLVLVRDEGGLLVDILEPHDSSLADNIDKARGFAAFAKKHGHLFGRIQLIREESSPAGGKRFLRLELNDSLVQDAVLLINSAPQLDSLFTQRAFE